jgi:hypothetical protein
MFRYITKAMINWNRMIGVAAYTLSRHGVHIDKLKKNEIELKKNVLLLLTI